MAPEKAPAFQFYPKDFLTDSHVVAMTLQELGAYIVLLCRCWLDCSIPTDMDALARLCRVPTAGFTKLWPALLPCFREVEGRFIQPRIEREREKQNLYREQKAEAGRRGGRPKAEAKQNESTSKAEVKQTESRGKANESSSSAICSLQSSDSSQVPAAPTRLVHSRSKRPIFTGQRLTVFEWMLDDCVRTLGTYADAFDLHEWFYRLDAAAARAELVIPQRDGGAWLQSQLLQEAQRRGLPFAVALPAPTPGKNATRIAAMLAQIKSEGA